MTKKLKLSLARALLPFVVVWSVVLPVRAYAGGLLDIGARVALAYITSPQTRFVVNNTIGLVLGATVLYLGVNRADNSGHQRDDQFFTTNNPRDPTAAEAAAGFQKAQPGGGSSPVPPPTVPPAYVWGVSVGGTVYGTSEGPACSAAALAYVGVAGATGVLTGDSCVIYNQYGSLWGLTLTMVSWTACPSGYSLASGGSCVLSNAAGVAKPVDSVCPIVRVGNAYSADTSDPDCSNGQAPTLTHPGAGVSVWTWTPSADGRHATLTQNADGTLTFVEAEPNTDGATTQTTTITTSPPVDDLTPPVVTGSGTVTTQGQGTAATSTVVQSTVIANPTVAPTDYAKTGDAAAAAASIIAADQAYHDGEAARTEQARGVPPSAESIPSQTIPVSFVPTIFASNATCPSPIGFDMFGHAYSISYDPACNLMAYLRPLFLALGAFSAAYVFMAGLKA